MTSVLTRWRAAPAQGYASAQGRAGRSELGSGMLVSAAIAGAGAATAGLIVLGAFIGLAWIVEPAVGGSILGPTRLSAQAWLLGHGADVAAGGIVVAVTPLGLTALLVVCCWYAAGWAGRRAAVESLAQIAVVLTVFVLTYTVIGVGLTLLGSTSGAEVPFESALSGLVALSLLAGVGGLLRTAGHGRLIHDVVPFPSRAVIAGVGAGAAILLAAGVGTLGVAIAVDRAGFAALTESVAPGWSAGLGLFVVSLLLLPNATVYAVAFLLGPGFSVGADTTVSVFNVSVGLVPGLPITAALPDEPVLPLGAILALTIPVLCGLIVGAVVVRRLEDDVAAIQAALWAALAGLVLAAALAVAQSMAGGSLGQGGLASIGAPAAATFVAAAALLALPAAMAAGLVRYRDTHRR